MLAAASDDATTDRDAAGIDIDSYSGIWHVAAGGGGCRCIFFFT